MRCLDSSRQPVLQSAHDEAQGNRPFDSVYRRAKHGPDDAWRTRWHEQAPVLGLLCWDDVADGYDVVRGDLEVLLSKRSRSGVLPFLSPSRYK